MTSLSKTLVSDTNGLYYNLNMDMARASYNLDVNNMKDFWQACVEEEEYLPALQGVHDVAPGEASVLVTLPDGHVWQEIGPVLLLVMLE